MNKQISICFASDDGYAEHLCVAIYSLLHNLNREYSADIFVLDSGISEEKKEYITKKVNEFKNGKISFIKMDSEKYKYLERGRLKKEVYLRLEIPEIFMSLDKMLYLDVDIVIDGDISEIYTYDIGKYALGAILDIGNYFHYKNLLKIPANYGYFNSGVCLLNLCYMRENGTSEKIIKYLQEAKNILSCDQDAMNAVLYNKWLSISPKFNFRGYERIDRYEKLFKNTHPIITKNEKPIIIHYTGEKPWNKYKCWFLNSSHPLVNKYFHYRTMAGLKPISHYKKTTMEKILMFFYGNIYNFVKNNIPPLIFEKYIFKMIILFRGILNIY